MRSTLVLSAAALAAQSAVALPASGLGKRGISKEEAMSRAESVKQVFQTAWDGYYKYVCLRYRGDEVRKSEVLIDLLQIRVPE